MRYAVTIGLLCVTWLAACAQDAPRPPARAQSWEYQTLSVPDAVFSRTINTLGKDGWDLVFARRVKDDAADAMEYEVIVKRAVLPGNSDAAAKAMMLELKASADAADKRTLEAEAAAQREREETKERQKAAATAWLERTRLEAEQQRAAWAGKIRIAEQRRRTPSPNPEEFAPHDYRYVSYDETSRVYHSSSCLSAPGLKRLSVRHAIAQGYKAADDCGRGGLH